MSRGWKIALIVVGLLMLNGIVVSQFVKKPRDEDLPHPLPPSIQTLRGTGKKIVTHDNEYELFLHVETKSGPTVHVTKISTELDEQDCERKRADPKIGIFECRTLRFSHRTADDNARDQSYATASRVPSERYVLSLAGAPDQESTYLVRVDAE
jgi:hypothetical protein